MFEERAKIVAEAKARAVQFIAEGETDEAFTARAEAAHEAGLPEPKRRGMESEEAKAKAYDIREKVLKLGINSLYGKAAQGIGGTEDKPPKYCCPWYAAAITAWTRARIIEACILKPRSIVNIATDGIIALEPLAPDPDPSAMIDDCPKIAGLPLVDEDAHGKILGTWTTARAEAGIFVKSGMYGTTNKGIPKTKMRGLKADFVNYDALMAEIPRQWKNGVAVYRYPNTSYTTIGAASNTRTQFEKIADDDYEIGRMLG